MARRVQRPLPPAPEVPDTPSPSRREAWLALGLAVATVALYWPVHGYDFVNYDDVDYVRRNAPVLAGLTSASVAWAFTTLYAGFWIPLTWLSFMADAQLFGTSAAGFHVTNVVLHAANTLLLFVLLSRATGRPWASAFVAGLFALHPVHVESVAWVTERKDVLSTLFLLLTLWAYGAYAARPTARRFLLTLLVFVLGLMAKPMLTTLPILLLLLDLWPLRRFSGVPPVRLLLEKLPFLLLALGSALLTMMAGNHLALHAPLEGVALGTRIANTCEAYVLYLVNTIWPIALTPLYPDPGPSPFWRAGLAALGLVVMTGVALRVAARHPWVTVGWLWYAVALLPVSGLVRIGPFVMADRFTYVPLIGIFVLVTWSTWEFAVARRLESVALAAAAVVLAGSTALARIQLGYWRDSVILFERTVAVTGPNPVAQYLLGLALVERGRPEEGMRRYAEALRLDPGYAHAHTSLGLLLSERGNVDAAIAHYDAALRAAPDDAYAHTNLANALLLKGRREDAIAHYTEALRLDPQLAGAHTGYGQALAATGQAAEAAAQYAVALRLDPDDAEAHNNLANALAGQGRVDDAVAHYTTALRLRPTYAAAHANLGLLLAEHGRFPDAAEHYVAALRLRPGDARLHGDFGNVLAAQGNLDDAVLHYREAIHLDPTDAGAHNNLANALVLLGRLDDGIAAYEEAIRLQPEYAEAHYNLGTVLADHGRSKEAIAHYVDALRVKPAYADAHTQLGLALRAEGRDSEAVRHFQEALRLNPADTIAQRELAVAGAGRP